MVNHNDMMCKEENRVSFVCYMRRRNVGHFAYSETALRMSSSCLDTEAGEGDGCSTDAIETSHLKSRRARQSAAAHVGKTG